MKKIVHLIILLIIHFCAVAQNAKIDSILIHEENYVDAILELETLGQKTLEASIPQLSSSLFKAKIYNALCWINFNSNPSKALKYAKLQLPLAEASKNDVAIVNVYDNLGYLYMELNMGEKGLEYMLNSLKIKEKLNDTLGVTVSLNGVANYYFNNEMYELALQYFKKVYNIEKNANRKENVAVLIGNIGTSFIQLNKIDSGLHFYLLSEKIYKELNQLDELGIIYSNIGDIYFKHKKDFTKALSFYHKSIPYLEKKELVSVLSKSYGHIAEIYIEYNQLPKSLYYANKSLDYAVKSNKKSDLLSSHKNLAVIYRIEKSYQKAYQHIQEAFVLKDSIFNEKNSQQIKEMLAKYDTERKEQEITLLTTEKKLDRIALEKKSFERNIFLIGLILTIFVAGYVVYSLNEKKKTNKLLQSQNVEISQKNKIIEEKNKDITDSINYAKNIQQTILPDMSVFENLVESFVFFQPKDIVSGDFYWVKEVKDVIYFAVVDCTGHGVPGAFMSIIGFNSLNRIVSDNEIKTTGEILDELNDMVNEALIKQTKEGVTIKDGMDLSLCAYYKNENRIEYSGAHNPLYIARHRKNDTTDLPVVLTDESYNFYEIKADKMPIGGGTNHKNYETHSLNLSINDSIYLFTDGYADQFGGPKGKKFMYKRFKQLLLSIQPEEMDTQSKILSKKLNEWKKDTEQVDDICVMGIRFNYMS